METDNPVYTQEQADRVRDLDTQMRELFPLISACESRYMNATAIADRALTESVHRRRRLLQMTPKERARDDSRDLISTLLREAANFEQQLSEVEEAVRGIMHDYRKLSKLLDVLRRERNELFLRGLTQALTMVPVALDDPALQDVPLPVLTHPDILPDETYREEPQMNPVQRARARAEEFFRHQRTPNNVIQLPVRPRGEHQQDSETD